MVLTLVQTVDTLLQQLETFLHKKKKKVFILSMKVSERWCKLFGSGNVQEITGTGCCATKPTFAMVFKLKSSCWILFCTFWISAIVWSSPLCWWGPGKTLTCFRVNYSVSLPWRCAISECFSSCMFTHQCVGVCVSHLGKPHSCASPSWALLAADASSAWCSARPAPSGPDGQRPACWARMPLEPCTAECWVSAFATDKTTYKFWF